MTVHDFNPVAFEAYRASGILSIDFHAYLTFMNGWVETCQLPPSERLKANASVTKKIGNIPKVYFLTSLMVPALDRVTEIDVRNSAHLHTAIVALAVERYRLAEGKLPNTLDDLVPGFLEETPIDPFDGKPLRYKRLEKGHLIYSIGADGEDNGGETEPPDHRGPPKNWDIPFRVER